MGMARRRRRRKTSDGRWIQKAVKRPGRVKDYLKRKYGSKAFTTSGEIKQSYLLKEIRRLKNKPRKTKQELSLYRAMLLAKRFELMRKGK